MKTLSARLNDGYAEAFIGPEGEFAHRYDAIEVHGVRDLNEPNDQTGTCCEVDDENPQFFSVYLHCRNGGMECVGDFSTIELAKQYAKDLSRDYGWPAIVAIAGLFLKGLYWVAGINMTLTTNQGGELVAITRTSEDHQILEVLWEKQPAV